MSSKEVVDKAFEFYDIPVKDKAFFGKIRERKFVNAKRSCTFVLHTINKTPIREIAKLLGIDRTTVLWYIKHMNDIITYDKEFCNYYCEFKKYLFQ